ncbi:hypothetical protein [Paenibacillus abyssi]|uniref:Uncharacterized protein n=1 Tax=Paenibacillus abyssi TaxID=1340531 RepID=A0A917LFA7_9BACL|nr:hypothetical protein [Paenibacillus abyssi]GGG18183.1 hypothetical protein GCM10010916_38750 [Paenibacillus abyssi]
MLRSYLESQLMLMFVMMLMSRQGNVRLYRPINSRLSRTTKRFYVNCWYRTIREARRAPHEKIAYVDIPECLLYFGDLGRYERSFNLKGSARRNARRSWKIYHGSVKGAA